MKRLILIFCLLLVFNSTTQAATKLYEYGFEDWGGTVATTSAYPYETASYCVSHQATTEVVSTYDSMTAQEGTYWFIANYDGTMSPSVSGITSSLTNPYCAFADNNTGLQSPCNQGTWEIADETTRLFYAQWYVRWGVDSLENPDVGSLHKMGRFDHGADGEDGILIMKIDNPEDVPKFKLLYGSQEPSSEQVPGLDDGNWHKCAMMADYTNSILYFWYDIETPTLSNYTLRITDCVSNDAPYLTMAESYPPDGLVIPANWSSMSFAGSTNTWEGIDGIEVWDGLPTAAETGTTIGTGNQISIDSSANDVSVGG